MPDDFDQEDPFKKYGGQQITKQEDPFKKYGGTVIDMTVKKKASSVESVSASAGFGGMGKLTNGNIPSGGLSDVSKTFKKNENPFDQTKEEAVTGATNKLNEIMYGDNWKDPVKAIHSGIKKSSTVKEAAEHLGAKTLVENSLMPDGYEAKKTLATTVLGELKDNETAKMVKARADEYDKVAQPFRELGDVNYSDERDFGTRWKIYDAAIKSYANKNPAFKKQAEAAGIDLNGEDLLLKLGSGSAKVGHIMENVLEDKDFVTFIQKENPSLLPSINKISDDLIYDNKDYGKAKLANEISREVQNTGYNNIDPIFNFAEGAKKMGDVVATGLYQNDPRKMQFYNEHKEEILDMMDAPSLMEGVAGGIKSTVGGLGKTFTEPFTPVSQTIKDNWEKEASNVSADPQGLMKYTRDLGHTLGMIATIGATGNVTGLSNAASTILAFGGDQLEQGKIKYPDSPVKAWTSAAVNTALYGALASDLFPAGKATQAFKSVQPEIDNVIESLASGTITKEAARQELNTLGKKAIDYAGNTLKGSAKVAAEMTGITTINRGLDKIMGLDDFEKYHPDDEIAKTLSSTFVGFLPVVGLAKYGEMKKGNRIVEESLYEAATNPKRYERVIEELQIKDPTVSKEDLVSNLRFLTDTKAELDKRGIDPQNQKRYLYEAMRDKVAKEAAAKLPDANLTRQHTEQIRNAQEVKDRILNGEDVAAEDRPLTPEQELLTKALPEISGIYRDAAKEALKDPEKTKQFLEEAKNQVNNEVASTIGDSGAESKGIFGETIYNHVKIADQVREVDNGMTPTEEQASNTDNVGGDVGVLEDGNGNVMGKGESKIIEVSADGKKVKVDNVNGWHPIENFKVDRVKSTSNKLENLSEKDFDKLTPSQKVALYKEHGITKEDGSPITEKDIENSPLQYSYDFMASSDSGKWNSANSELESAVQGNRKQYALYKLMNGEFDTFKEFVDFINSKNYGDKIEYTDRMKRADDMSPAERKSAIDSYNKSVEDKTGDKSQKEKDILEEHGLKDETEYSPHELVEKFPLKGVQKVIWDIISPIVKKLGIKVKFSSSRITEGFDGSSNPMNGEVLLRPSTLKNGRLGEVLVHEVVHSLTTKIISRVNSGVETGLTSKQVAAVKGLGKLYKSIEADNNLQNKYPVKDIFEFIAHLTNDSFVKELESKDRNFIQKVVDFISDILGLTNANELAKKYLKDIIHDGTFLEKEGITVVSSDYAANVKGAEGLTPKQRLLEAIKNNSKTTAEKYHDLKSKGKENDFTKAVEQSLSKPSTPTVQEGKGDNVGEDVGLKKVKIGDFEKDEMLSMIDNRKDTVEEDPESSFGIESETGALDNLKQKIESGDHNFTRGELEWLKSEADDLLEKTQAAIEADGNPEAKKRLPKIKKFVSDLEQSLSTLKEKAEQKTENNGTQKANEEGGGSDQPGKQQATQTGEPIEPPKTEGEGTEPPLGKPEEPVSEENPAKNKSLAVRLVNAKNIPEAAKRGIEANGLKYEPQSHEEALGIAKSIIEEVGMDEAVLNAQAQKFGGDVNTLVQTEALNKLAELSDAEKDPVARLEHDKKFAEISIGLDESLRKQGRGISAVNYFYKKSPLGMQMVENTKRKEDFQEWSKPKDKSWKEFFDEMVKEPEFEAIIKEQVKEGMKQERAEARKTRIQKVDDFIDKAKDQFKNGAIYSTLIPPKVITTALEGIKKAYHAGEQVAKIIEDAIDYISTELKGASWDKEKFRKEWESKLGKGVEKETTVNREKRIEYLKGELDRIQRRKQKEKKEPGQKKEIPAEEQSLIDEIEAEQTKWDSEKDAARQAANDYKKMETERNRQLKRVGELNDKIETLKKGELPEVQTKNPKVDTPEIEALKAEKEALEKSVRTSISHEAKMKDLEKELQRLKDRKKKEPKPESKKVISEEERQLRDEIEAERKAWVVEKNIERLYDELQNVKARSKKVNIPKEKRELTEDEQDLIRQIKEERAIWAKEVEPERKVREALKVAQKSFDEYQRRIDEGDISKKESDTPDPPQLKALREKRDAKRKEYEAMKKQMTKPTQDQIDALTKQRILDKFRNKLKGLSDKEKEEVVRKSFKKIVESGGLDYADFKEIIADVTGRGGMTDAEATKLKDLVKKLNSVEEAGKKAREERTPEALKAFRQAEIDAGKASKELNDLLGSKPNIIRRITSIMQLNTLGIPALVNNPIYNVWNQATLRFPIGVVNTLIDQAISGVAQAGGKEYNPETNILRTQKEFFSKLGLGLKESAQQFGTGLNRMDYTQKEIYGQQIRPFKAIRDLWAAATGKKKLTGAQVVDKSLQGTVGIPAEIVARVLNLGDKPQRFAAEGSQAAAFAKALGLKDMDYRLFIEFPREEAYRAYKAKGLSDAEAGKRADYVKDTVVKEGERSTFQQDNMLNDVMNKIFGGKDSGVGGLVKSLTVSPYIKIPANAYWSYYNLVNPEVALLQSMWYGGKALSNRGKNDNSAAKDLHEARYWFAHAATGIAMRAVVTAMVTAGIYTSSNTEDDTKKEREGEQNYEPQGTVNVTKLAAWLRGEDPSKIKGGLTVQNRWFGQWGSVGNTIAKRYQDMTPEQREKGEEYMDMILGNLQQSSLKELEQGIFANSSSLLQALSSEGSYGLKRWGMNTVNMMTNIVHPAALAQISRAELPYQSNTKADTFLGELKNSMLQRSSVLRSLTGKYPPNKIGIWGDKLERTDDVAMKLFGISKTNKDNFAQPIYDDYKKTNDIGFFPPAVPPVLNGKKLSADEERKLDEYVGQARKSYIAPFINDQANIVGYNVKYSQLDNKDKKEVLQYLYSLGKEDGVARFTKEHPDFGKVEEKVDYKKETQQEIFRLLQKYKN